MSDLLNLRTHSFLSAVAVILALSIAQAGLADTIPTVRPFESDKTDCGFFLSDRFGELREETLRVPRWGADDQTVKIRYRYDYLRQPNVPDTLDGSLPGSQSFEIELETGTPPEMSGYARRHALPQKYTHFSLFVKTGLDRPIWVYLNRLDKRGPSTGSHLTLTNGDIVRKPVNFSIGDLYIGDFREISWNFTLGERDARSEYAVAMDDSGKITELLRCHREGTYPNPGCRYSFRNDPFWARVRFNRSEIDKIDYVRNWAQSFVSCLADGGSK